MKSQPMSELPRGLYRFVTSSKFEMMTARGKVFVFNSPGSGERVSLRENEYDLATLFNGRRSEEEVRDLVQKAKGLALSAEDLRDFIDKLNSLGLLEDLSPPPPAPVRARREPVLTAGEREDFDLDSGLDLADGPVERAPATARGKRRSRRSSWQDQLSDSDAANDSIDVEDAHFADRVDFTDSNAAFREGGAPHHPNELLDEAFQGAGRSAGRRAAPTKSKAPRLLFRFPVSWLLPLAAPLGWAGRNRYAALLLFALLGAAVLGLSLSRVELTRDLERWLHPTTIAQTFILALFTVNLWAQLARAAEYKRHLGVVPPFGMALAWNVVPIFAVDLSGLAKARDIVAARAVFAASLSAVGTICLLTYTGWLAGKNSGTAMPLLILGVAFGATIRLLLSLNPLARRDGYYLMALTLGIPDLRQRAFGTLFGREARPLLPTARARPPGWVLFLYGLALVAYVVAVLVFMTLFVGGWLTSHWGGFGALVYLAVLGLVFWSPIQEVTEHGASPSRAVQLYRKRSPRQRIWSMSKLALVLLVVIAIGMIPYRYEPGGEFVLRPLQTKRTDVRSVISGRVNEVLVKEGSRVESEQILARVSGDEERRNVQSTEASIRGLEAQLSKALSGATPEAIAVARQRVSTAKTRLQYSDAKAERWKDLQASGFVSEQDYANALGQADTDREQLLQAEKELSELLAGTRKEEIEALRAAIDEQRANLRYYQQQQRNTDIRAPIAGYIVSGSLIAAAGNYLKQGDLLLTVEDASDLVAEIKVPQFDIGLAKIGAPIRLKAWAHPDLQIDGRVVSIAPAAEETPSGKTVRVMSELDNRSGLLKSGTTGYAKIEGEEMPAALAFTRWVMRFLKVELWSWLP